MNKYDPPEPIRGEARLNDEKLNWLYNSHLWYKDKHRQVCEWCGAEVFQHISIEYPGLCPENPFVYELVNRRCEQVEMELGEND